MYFYVQKSSTDLPRKLGLGPRLELAMDIGRRVDALFFSSPLIKGAVEHTNFTDRLVLRIENSEMHPDRPVDRPELWLDVGKF